MYKKEKRKYQRIKERNNKYIYNIYYIIKKEIFILLVMEDNIKIVIRGVGEEGREEEEAEIREEKRRKREIYYSSSPLLFPTLQLQ